MFIQVSSLRIHVHYYRFDEQYDDWDVWVWPIHRPGVAVPFTNTDDFGPVATVVLDSVEGISKFGFIVRKNTLTTAWIDREQQDRFIETLSDDGDAHVWIIQGDPIIYTDRARAMSRRIPRIVRAELLLSQRIEIEVTPPNETFAHLTPHVVIEQRDSQQRQYALSVQALHAHMLHATVLQPLDIIQPYEVHLEGYPPVPLSLRQWYDHPAFIDALTYAGNDLGTVYTPSATSFRVWAPTAFRVAVHIGSAQGTLHIIAMERSDGGTYYVRLEGDWEGATYRYEVWQEPMMSHLVVDPYATAVMANGTWAVIIDLHKTDPIGWSTDVRPPLRAPTDAVIYEMHVRDATIHPSSGCAHKGTFIGLTQPNTATPSGYPTGLAYVEQLEVTHVQLLPVHDFVSVDETDDRPQYNWGYDPAAYFVPEGSYSTNAVDPYARIRELKSLVLQFHQKGMRVVLDVVFNHLFSGMRSALQQIVPDYYFRFWQRNVWSDGTGCGNDTASERIMMRKLICDSVTYWVTQYHVDGFRFDLMGCHDIDTMNAVRACLDAIDPTLLLYGEGWELPTTLPEQHKATLAHAQRMPRVGQFNDRLRDAIKGKVFSVHDEGFVNGSGWRAEDVWIGVAGSVPLADGVWSWTEDPAQTINYVEVHDNHTLWDRLSIARATDSESDRMRMHRLATAIVLTAQGIPLLHAGQEFFRTKYGVHDSYRSPDAINALDYTRAEQYAHNVHYVRQLIRLRRRLEALRLPSGAAIRQTMRRIDSPTGTIAFLVQGDPTVVVAYNPLRIAVSIHLPAEGPWDVYAHDDQCSDVPLQEHIGSVAEVAPLSMSIWARS